MAVDGDEGNKAEKQPGFLAQLQAILNVLPAYTWYAAPRGALTFVNTRTAEYLGIPNDHPLRLASTLAQSGTTRSRCCIRTTAKMHANTGQAVCARARAVSIAIEFAALKETTAGSSLAWNRSEQATEPYFYVLGRLWTLKSSCARRRHCVKANEDHVQHLTG